jgi:hypothetical protein
MKENYALNKPYKTNNPKWKGTRDRCFKCGSYALYIKRDSTWPSLMCGECGAFVRDFGD